MHLALVILAVDDVARSREFYVRVLGWDVEVDEAVYVELHGSEGMRLGLYERTAYALNTEVPVGDRTPPGRVAATELYFMVDDVRKAVERMDDVGGSAISNLRPRVWGDDAVYYTDPDGNVVVFASPHM